MTLDELKAQRTHLSSKLSRQEMGLQVMGGPAQALLTLAKQRHANLEAQLTEAQAAVAKLCRQLGEAAADEAAEQEKMDEVIEMRKETDKVSSAIDEIDAELSARAEVRKGKRKFAKLHHVLPYGSLLSISSCGATWALRYTARGFEREGIVFKSPGAVTSAHARLIHEGHPAETLPGNGWAWLKVAAGEHEGKTIGNVYDAYFGF